MVPYTELLAELSTLPREDAKYLGCIGKIKHAHKFVRYVTSNHRQFVAYQGTLTDGADQRQALEVVVDLPSPRPSMTFEGVDNHRVWFKISGTIEW